MIDIVLDANCLISYISLKSCSMNTLKGLGSDIKLRSIKQVSASTTDSSASTALVVVQRELKYLGLVVSKP